MPSTACCVKKYAGRYWDSNRIVYFRRPLLACVLLFSLRKEICRPILGLEPTQFISEGHCQPAFYSFRYVKKYAGRYWDSNQNSLFPKATGRQHAFNCLGYVKKYDDRYWDSNQNTLFPKATGRQHAFNCLGYVKKYAGRYWVSNQHSLFPKATGRQHTLNCLGQAF